MSGILIEAHALEVQIHGIFSTFRFEDVKIQ